MHNNIFETGSQWVKEAELEEALAGVKATMHGITYGAAAPGTALGPTLTARVQLEGKETEALLDTGSPVSIVSLQFLLEALAESKDGEQSPSGWRAMVEEQLEPPTVTLRNYSGAELDIIRQIKVNISRPGFPGVPAMVQVQNKVPTKLLLGTDVLSSLGFVFLQTEADGVDINLLEPQKVLSAEVGEVRLIGAIRVPARHQKLLRAQVLGCEEELTLFEPDQGQLSKVGLTMAEAVMQSDGDCCVTLVVQNPSGTPMHLEDGQVLGRAHPVVLCPPDRQDTGVVGEPEPAVNRVEPDPAQNTACLTEGQRDRLLAALQMATASLVTDQQQALRALLLEFGDAFALDSSELGSTDLVTHTIDTANSPPIR